MIIHHRLTPARENYIREQQADFRPGRGCIDHIFTLRQHLEHRNTFHRSTIVMFLDLKAAFDSVDREALFHCMLTQSVPPKYVNILKALYPHNTRRVRVYRQLSRCFELSSGVRQGCPLSPFLFNFEIDDIMKQPLHNSATRAPDADRNKMLFDLEYANDIVCYLESFTEAQTLLDSLIHSAARYGLKFAPSKYKLMLFNWTGPIQQILMEGEDLEQVDKFT